MINIKLNLIYFMKKTLLIFMTLLSFAAFTSCDKEEDDSSKDLPVVETGTIGNISFNSCIVNTNNVTSQGASAVTQKGICYGTSSNPVYTETPPNYVNNGGGTGEFTSSITNLQTQTTYYVRAYAKNANGIGYGTAKSFKTN